MPYSCPLCHGCLRTLYVLLLYTNSVVDEDPVELPLVDVADDSPGDLDGVVMVELNDVVL